MSSTPARVGILGGTGAQGRGLARRFAQAGHEVLIGSRDPARAAATAAELDESPSAPGRVRGVANAEAAEADLVIVAVPYDGHRALLEGLAGPLAGRVVIDCVNPLRFDRQGPYPLAVPAGSAAQEAQEALPGSTVVAAFHHVSAVLLDDPEGAPVELDVLVLGEDRDAVARVCALAEAIPGVRGLYGGRLRNAAQVEAFTANLIAVNRRYRTHAGLRLTGVDPAAAR